MYRCMMQIWGGPPKTGIRLLEFVYFSYMCKSVTFKVLSIWCNTPIDMVFHFSKSIWTHQLMPFSASAVFFFLLFHIRRTFPIESFFSPRETEKSSLGQGQVNRQGGAWGLSCFGWKTAATCSAGRCTRESPIMKWANASSLQKQFTESEPMLCLITPPAGAPIHMGS